MEPIKESIAPGPRNRSCNYMANGTLEPCTVVIFGASGDLTARKLVPALYDLFVSNSLPRPINIVGCSRSALTDRDFRRKMAEAVRDADRQQPTHWESFAKNLHYQKVIYDARDSFANLAVFLKDLDRQTGTGGNRLFYLAVPPTLSPGISLMLGDSGLAEEFANGNGWSRIVVEKPFGRDIETAMELDRTLHKNFREHQIFRIDHYLAKETVQNILMLRFANGIFEPIWNRSFIDYVGIIAAEELGVEHRAGFYEQAGVLRDMFQNHMKQLLSLTAMEPPSIFEADRVRDEKAKTFRSLKPLDRDTLAENLILGQYGAGSIRGKRVVAYRDEPDVDPNSLVPTFAMMRVFVDNWRWQGVPFYMVSGKRLAKKVTRIVVQFKQVPHSMFQNVIAEHIEANRLLLGIYPEEQISLTFQTKSPGARVCLRPVTMDFKYYGDYEGLRLEAYAKVLLDCILGDQMLFWRQDGVELAWKFLTPILEQCEQCGDLENLLHFYEAGGWGPEQARQWMRMIMDEMR